MKQERITELWPTSYYKKIESATEKKKPITSKLN